MKKEFSLHLYKKEEIQKGHLQFENKALLALLLPVIVEQLLNSFMGMADTMMVSNVGSAALSAVSLVDSINNLVIQVFAAMAAGAAIICSQYLGSRDEKGSNKAARQIVFTVFIISMLLTVVCLIFRVPLLHIIFGKVEKEVMDNSLIYFFITVLSYPFLAMFNAGSAFYRADGNSRFPMMISVISNVMNIVGNAILIFGFGMGIVGAAISTLASRIFCAIVIFYYLRKPKQKIVVKNYLSIRPEASFIKKILAISIPSGIENGMFQFGKLAIQSTVSTMGTAAIAAQAMTNILEMLNGIVGIGVGIGLMTVVAQCVGAGRREEAKYNILKLTFVGEIGVLTSCLLVYAATFPVTRLAGMDTASAKMCMQMMFAITCVKPIVWTLSFVPAYGMRAAGDVQFSMIVSSITMWCCRVALCIFLVKVFHMGPMAVWIGMFADWTIRGVIFTTRFLSGKWLKKKLI